MQTYIVGGAVRDELLGRPNADRDYVVVGATPKPCWRKASGRWARISRFSCTLIPTRNTRWRTERKTGRGYHGFAFHAAPDVTSTMISPAAT